MPYLGISIIYQMKCTFYIFSYQENRLMPPPPVVISFLDTRYKAQTPHHPYNKHILYNNTFSSTCTYYYQTSYHPHTHTHIHGSYTSHIISHTPHTHFTFSISLKMDILSKWCGTCVTHIHTHIKYKLTYKYIFMYFSILLLLLLLLYSTIVLYDMCVCCVYILYEKPLFKWGI